MKIGYVNPYPLGYGGGEVRLHYLASELSYKGHEVSIIIPKHHGRFKPEKQIYEVVEVGQSLPDVKTVMFAPFMLSVVRKLHNYDIIDIAHPYSNVISRLFKISNISNRSTKIVCTVQGMSTFKNSFRINPILSPLPLFLRKVNLFSPYDAIVTVSNSIKSEILGTGINPDLISVIPNGIDLRFYKSVEVEKKYPKPTVVCMSRLDRTKRLDTLIEILFHLRHEYNIPNSQLIIIGEGPDRSRLERRISELNLEKSVKLAGYIDGEEKVRILKSSDVFAFPSELESFGLAPLEGMACGLPVVVNKIPALREVLGDATLYAKSTQEFCEQVSELLTNRKLYEEYSQRSEKKAQEYTWEECVSITEELYESLLGN